MCLAVTVAAVTVQSSVLTRTATSSFLQSEHNCAVGILIDLVVVAFFFCAVMGPRMVATCVVTSLGGLGMVLGSIFETAPSCLCGSASLVSASTMGMTVFCGIGCGLCSRINGIRSLIKFVICLSLMIMGMIVGEVSLAVHFARFCGTQGASHWAMMAGMLLGTSIGENLCRQR